MKNFRHSSKRGSRMRNSNGSSNNQKATIDLLRLILCHLTSPQGEGQATFSRVNLEGSNVGSSMLLRRSGDSKDRFSINVYVNNNVQGVNNSILVGSSVMMRDPGVEFSFGGDPRLDALRRRKDNEKAKAGSFWGGWFIFFFAIAVLWFLFV